MEPRIQYATTSDGLHIAFAVSGSGPALISVPAPPDNHIQLEWAHEERRRSIELLSAHRTLVRFDGRGTGLSDRDAADFSLESRLRDLDAVVEKLGVETFALASGGHGNQVTVAYAALHPERVTHLVAVNPFVLGQDFMSPRQLELWRTMLMADFRLFTDALGAEMFGWGKEEGPRYAAFFRECVEPKTAFRIYSDMLEVDLTPYLERVACSTLVIRSVEGGMISEPAVRRFAASLKDARFVVAGERPVEGATPEMIRQIGLFFGEDWSGPESRPVPAPAIPAEFRTILFTDVEGHSAIMSRLGDSRGREVMRQHEGIIRSALRDNAGMEVKALGDGFMASFASATRALECAIGIQRAFEAPTAGGGEQLRIRVGINAGEPIAEQEDLYGRSVITAARVAEKAVGGQILVTDVVRQLVAGRGFLFSDTGEHVLKGMEEPARVWELRWQEPE
jgi:class 3 adenylate cyclase